MKRLTCEGCGANLELGDVDKALGLAHCRGCGAVWTLGAPAAPKAASPAPPRPASWVEADDGGLVLTSSWRSTDAIFPVGFALFWNGIMAVMGVAIVASGDFDPVGFLAMGPHLLVGLGMGWYGAASALNTTVVAVRGGRLTVTHGPVPWWGQVELPTDAIDQLHVEESGVRVNKRARFNLRVTDRDGVTRTLLSLLKTAGEARWLEHRIEGALGVEDREVPDEIAKVG